jgi:hypothetical protein
MSPPPAASMAIIAPMATSGSVLAADVLVLRGPTVRPRERKPSETVPVDLLRVVEESEELLNE